MADTEDVIALTILGDDDTFTSSFGTHYVEFHNARMEDVDDASNDADLIGRADFAVEIDDLVRIARKAAAYINAESRQSLEWVAESGQTLVNDLKAAGFISDEEADEWRGE